MGKVLVACECSQVAYSGEWSLMVAARAFFLSLLAASIPRVCIENPKPTARARLPPCSLVLVLLLLWLRNGGLLYEA